MFRLMINTKMLFSNVFKKYVSMHSQKISMNLSNKACCKVVDRNERACTHVCQTISWSAHVVPPLFPPSPLSYHHSPPTRFYRWWMAIVIDKDESRTTELGFQVDSYFFFPSLLCHSHIYTFILHKLDYKMLYYIKWITVILHPLSFYQLLDIFFP